MDAKSIDSNATADGPTRGRHRADGERWNAVPGAAPPPVDDVAILARARRGDSTVLPRVEKILDERPGIWKNCNDLTKLSEQAWIDRVAVRDLVLGQSLRRQVEKMKADLTGPNPSPLERVLVGRIGSAWLGVQHAELAEATRDGGDGVKVAQLRVKRLDAANRRFLASTKALAVVRRLVGGLKVEINHNHGAAAAMNQPSGETGHGTQATSDVTTAARLNAFFGEGVKADEALCAKGAP